VPFSSVGVLLMRRMRIAPPALLPGPIPGGGSLGAARCTTPLDPTKDFPVLVWLEHGPPRPELETAMAAARNPRNNGKSSCGGGGDGGGGGGCDDGSDINSSSSDGCGDTWRAESVGGVKELVAWVEPQLDGLLKPAGASWSTQRGAGDNDDEGCGGGGGARSSSSLVRRVRGAAVGHVRALCRRRGGPSLIFDALTPFGPGTSQGGRLPEFMGSDGAVYEVTSDYRI